ncbi:hypothetical protein HKX48_003181 [Thoreauomyces humboldtii]|nr:hypothetical protein HKX48_003181 [Thoreauomyces humboldtii]
MDQLFASLAISGATIVSKAAFSYAQGYAVKQISTFVANTTADKSHLHSELVSLQKTLQLKLAIVTPAIDTCEILAARGSTTLEAVLLLANDLRVSLAQMGQRAASATVSDSTALAVSSGPTPAGDQLSPQTALTAKLIADVKSVLAQITDLVPFLTLSLQNSGAHLSARLPDSISPSRLLQASTALALASSRYDSHRHFGPTQPPNPVQVGRAFPVRVYSLFRSSARAKGRSDATWKEDHPKASVTVERVTGSSKNIAYELVIAEDLDDGRVHDDDEQGTKAVAKIRRVDLTALRKVYYSRSGELLNIDGAKAPVMVVKLDDGGGPSGASHSTTTVAILGTPDRRPHSASSSGEAEYLAFELIQEEDEGPSDDEDDSESDSDEESRAASPIPSSKRGKSTQVVPLQPPRTPTTTPVALLSTLEYVLRLATLEVSEQRSHLETPDEKLALYLSEELTGGKRRKSDTMDSDARGVESHRDRMMLGVENSPLARKAGGALGRTSGSGTPSFVDRLRDSAAREAGSPR